MPTTELYHLGNLALTYVSAFALAAARPAAMAVVLPIFTRLGLSGLLRTAVILGLALPLVPQVVAVLAASELATPGRLVALMGKEAVIGVLLGLAFGTPFWAAESAGNVVDVQRGASAAQLFDPSMTYETSVTGTLLAVMLVTLFFASGGFLTMMEALFDSYRLWPLAKFLPSLSPEAPGLLLGLLDRILSLTLALAGPLMVAMFLADGVLGLINRFAPQLNSFNLSLAVKSLTVTLLMPVYLVFLVEYARDELAQLRDVMSLLGRYAVP